MLSRLHVFIKFISYFYILLPSFLLLNGKLCTDRKTGVYSFFFTRVLIFPSHYSKFLFVDNLVSVAKTLRLNYKHNVSELIVPFGNFTALQLAEATLNLVSFFGCILHGYWTIFSLSIIHPNIRTHRGSQHLGQCLGAVTCFSELVWAGLNRPLQWLCSTPICSCRSQDHLQNTGHSDNKGELIDL